MKLSKGVYTHRLTSSDRLTTSPTNVSIKMWKEFFLCEDQQKARRERDLVCAWVLRCIHFHDGQAVQPKQHSSDPEDALGTCMREEETQVR